MRLTPRIGTATQGFALPVRLLTGYFVQLRAELRRALLSAIARCASVEECVLMILVDSEDDALVAAYTLTEMEDLLSDWPGDKPAPSFLAEVTRVTAKPAPKGQFWMLYQSSTLVGVGPMPAHLVLALADKNDGDGIS